ncbi:tetratricopeptide repeat protein (plasmid) [Deinococcus sp. KNUC1210]|uniref:tetratricopeptide repeat protein n=1 Tax=Deinococcus sp. KNUC1210 TaxID=2917691 RepID=UPI001EF043C9|nr:tetratricopeptide repeat protein [Deinococcus sp. KNUC1210]ULH18012.1 tetratricopeptide repeat protein [Deinococcus sp. KNUC1210]
MTETHGATQQQEHLFQQGAYLELIEVLNDVAVRTARQQTLLGLAYFRLGRMQDSRPLLAAALKAREPEAMVEWGNYLRAQGRFAEAQRYVMTPRPKGRGFSGQQAP